MLPTVVVREKAVFPAEELREMARIGIAHIEGDSHYALFRFAQHRSERLSMGKLFAVITKSECAEIEEKGGALPIEVVEKGEPEPG